jgi:hypothetical protein
MSGPDKGLKNLRMAEKLERGEAIDVNMVGDPLPNFPGVWVMEDFLDGMDYCDAENEVWIWSIGRHNVDGKYYAATDTRFYQNPLFECVWLR